MTEPKNGNGFAQRALIIGSGAILAILMGFFTWLALAIVEIRVNVAEMKRDIAGLTAVQERGTPVDPTIERNTRRLDRLEQQEPPAPPNRDSYRPFSEPVNQ